MKTVFGIWLIIFFSMLFSFEITAQGSSPKERPLLSLIKEIEQNTDVRFLYREALISNVEVSIDPTSNSVFEDLESKLRLYEIGLQIDFNRRQALLFKVDKREAFNNATISGYVLDASSGDRLPYSTISWYENGEITGIASSSNGTFKTLISTSENSKTLLFSFVGYESKRVEFDLTESNNLQDVAIRLNPVLYSGNEIIVNGTSLFSPADTVFTSMIEAGAFSPLGNNNSIQALQSLPSVISGPAIQDGLHVRGSSSDGFRVLLDGITLYNQSHLFGLLDGLNSDVLRTSGFFYDVTPAQYRAPLGGTLSFLTKTGNLNRFTGSGSLSNTSFGGTLEGPVRKGQSSFLISGRHSYIDNVNWFNNQEIIEYGLDINRNFEFQADTMNELPDRGIRDINGNALFYDLHGKVYLENKSGTQWILSAYTGKDEASQQYERGSPNQSQEFSTDNEWSSSMIKLSMNTSLANDVTSESSIGFSDYYSSYFKEDNAFRRIENSDPRNPQFEVLALSLENELQEFQVNQQFNKRFSALDAVFGFTYSDFQVLYTEISPRNESFRSRRTGQLFDIFTQLDFTKSRLAHVSLGGRMYYFSNGKYLEFSPRVKTQFFPESLVSFGLGYSKNYQFLHQLQFETINSTDFWVLSNFEQPPSSVDDFSTNVRIRPGSGFYLQAEAYYKLFENLRIHSLLNELVSSFFDESENSIPFLFNNDGVSKGIEFLAKKRFKNLRISSTYTLSSSELENIFLNDGKPFKSSFDRTHQFSTSMNYDIGKGFQFYSSWTYATGTPNSFLSRDLKQESRIGDYSRLDISVKYIHASEGREKSEFQFSVYNALNRKNPWYAEAKPGLSTVSDRVAFGSASVFDLGIQPSFEVKFYF